MNKKRKWRYFVTTLRSGRSYARPDHTHEIQILDAHDRTVLLVLLSDNLNEITIVDLANPECSKPVMTILDQEVEWIIDGYLITRAVLDAARSRSLHGDYVDETGQSLPLF